MIATGRSFQYKTNLPIILASDECEIECDCEFFPRTHDTMTEPGDDAHVILLWVKGLEREITDSEFNNLMSEGEFRNEIERNAFDWYCDRDW